MTAQGDRDITRSLARVAEHLSAEFPELGSVAVQREVTQVARILLGTARFTDFVPVLTYRQARERLRNLEQTELRPAA